MFNLKFVLLPVLVLTGSLSLAADTGDVYSELCECKFIPPDKRTIPVLIRDFKHTHPDFEYRLGEDYGIVDTQLGADGRPVYKPATKSLTTTGKANFDQWFRDVPGVNISIPKSLELTEVAPGLWQYHSTDFFPINGEGFGNYYRNRNYHFTLEMHLKFTYMPGTSFTFTGDDDLFLFINNRLAVDIGGVHGAISRTIDLDQMADELGIEVGGTYSFDLFFAERHTVESNFQFQTTMQLECLGGA